jgi:dUTPase
VILFNHGPNYVRIRAGMKVGQIEFYRVPPTWLWQMSGDLSSSERGEKRFGSSGQ